MKQYSPIGQWEQIPQENYNFDDNKLEVEIFIDSNKYYKGKLINLLMKITNTSDQKISYIPKFNLIDSDKNKKLRDYTSYNVPLRIDSGETKYHTFPLVRYYNLRKHYNLGNRWPYLETGNYDFYITVEADNEIYKSNSISFEIIPLTEEHKKYFDLLNSKNKSVEVAKQNHEKNKDTFWAHEFYTDYIEFRFIAQKDAKLYVDEAVDFLKKYPNDGNAHHIIHTIMAYREYLGENIITDIKSTMDSIGGWSSKIFNNYYERGIK